MPTFPVSGVFHEKFEWGAYISVRKRAALLHDIEGAPLRRWGCIADQDLRFVRPLLIEILLVLPDFQTLLRHCQSCSVSRETTDVTAIRGILWSDKV